MAKSFFFFLLLVVLLPLVRSTSPAAVFLSCGAGAGAGTTVEDGRVFVPDSPFLPRRHLSGSLVSTASDPENSPPLYTTARIFPRPSSYRFGISKSGTFLLRLHFYPFASRSCDLSHARFHVLAGDSVLLSDFHVGKMSPLARGCGGVHMDRSEPTQTRVSLVLKEYFLYVDDSDELVVTFLPSDRSSFAFVNAIELVAASNLVPEIALTVTSTAVEKSDGFSNHNYEVLYRANMGGSKITSYNDTMWRNWVPDDDFLDVVVAAPNSVSEKIHFAGRIQYQEYGASREIAPYSVYDTARVLKVGNFDSNMTWVFHIPHNYTYLVRLHFCDIASLALNELYFNIFLNGHNASENFDLSTATNWHLAAPYYLDLVSQPDSEGRLVVTIAPSNLSRHSRVNGLLNGLEIMKLNDSMGNLDDQVPMSLILSSRAAGGVGEFGRMFLCGTLFLAVVLAGLMLLAKWRSASRISSGWSSLPTFAPEGKTGFTEYTPVGKYVEF